MKCPKCGSIVKKGVMSGDELIEDVVDDIYSLLEREGSNSISREILINDYIPSLHEDLFTILVQALDKRGIIVK